MKSYVFDEPVKRQRRRIYSASHGLLMIDQCSRTFNKWK